MQHVSKLTNPVLQHKQASLCQQYFFHLLISAIFLFFFIARHVQQFWLWSNVQSQAKYTQRACYKCNLDQYNTAIAMK